jgi:hypothetical protein
MGFYAIGSSQPVIYWSFGKPAPQADGRIRYDFSNQPYSFMTPMGTYEARVVAVGSKGEKWMSDPSNPFSIVR